MSRSKTVLQRVMAFTVVVLFSSAGSRAEQPEGSAALPLLEGDQVTGDWVGRRPLLCDCGLEIFGVYSGEVWGNTLGGLKTGTVYTSEINFGVNLDLDKLIGWKGASMRTTWLWLNGQDASADLVGNFLTISNIAGLNALRMFELWFQQNLVDEKVSIRFGQLAADSEFLISNYAGLFINGTFGLPAVAYMNIPNGGPGYPMGTLGTRLALNPVDWFTFQTAVFQGNVFAQNVNRYGFRWRLDAETGWTFLNEVQFRWNQRAEETGLPGQFKSGAWFQTGQSADVLAETTSSGNSGFYLVLDQMLYREPDGAVASDLKKDGKSAAEGSDGKSFKDSVNREKSNQGLGMFGRVAFTPADRNFIGFYFDTGLTYKGPIPTRDDDTIGIGFGYAQLTNGERNSLSAGGSSPAIAEMVLEVTYQAKVTRWLTIQPDLQYIINPGGRSDLPNAFVIGGRAAVTF